MMSQKSAVYAVVEFENGIPEITPALIDMLSSNFGNKYACLLIKIEEHATEALAHNSVIAKGRKITVAGSSFEIVDSKGKPPSSSNPL